MTARIVQWGTGNVGKHALRAIVEYVVVATSSSASKEHSPMRQPPPNIVTTQSDSAQWSRYMRP